MKEHMASLPLINDFAKRSFRDVADQDYIAARMSYKAQLREPFLWSSLQAFEKYFKAILLFNRKSAKGIGHNINEGLRRVENIKDISFSIPDDVREFIDYINNCGTNRYLEYSTYLRNQALFSLDKSVWYVRRHCFYMRGELTNSKGETIELLPFNVQKTKNFEEEVSRYKYTIQGGLLEEIISKNKTAAESLIWHNFYYGSRQKKIIKNHVNHMSTVNPTLTMHPEIFEELDSLVDFSKETHKFFKNKANN